MPAINELSVPFISAYRERKQISWEVILVSLWDGFDGIFKINIQIHERYDGANKMKIQQVSFIPQTVLYLEQRNWK